MQQKKQIFSAYGPEAHAVSREVRIYTLAHIVMFADGLPVDILNGLDKVSSALTDFIVKVFLY